MNYRYISRVSRQVSSLPQRQQSSKQQHSQPLRNTYALISKASEHDPALKSIISHPDFISTLQTCDDFARRSARTILRQIDQHSRLLQQQQQDYKHHEKQIVASLSASADSFLSTTTFSQRQGLHKAIQRYITTQSSSSSSSSASSSSSFHTAAAKRVTPSSTGCSSQPFSSVSHVPSTPRVIQSQSHSPSPSSRQPPPPPSFCPPTQPSAFSRHRFPSFSTSLSQQRQSHTTPHHTQHRSIATSSQRSSAAAAHRSAPKPSTLRRSARPAAILTTARRNFQFRRYILPSRWNPFRGAIDIFSPWQSFTSWFRPLRYKFRRFLPGRFVGYFGLMLQYMIYAWLLVMILERNREFSTGWSNPESSNWGYFLRRDWSSASAQYTAEIWRKRRRFRKQDGNRWRHEEDLRIDRTKDQRWEWMKPDRFGQPRGIWPLRSYVINSPMYLDRKYFGRGRKFRHARLSRWNKMYFKRRRRRYRRKRALRLRGHGKYEYGGTAHHYYFTKTKDRDHFLTLPRSDLPPHVLPDAAKY